MTVAEIKAKHNALMRKKEAKEKKRKQKIEATLAEITVFFGGFIAIMLFIFFMFGLPEIIIFLLGF